MPREPSDVAGTIQHTNVNPSATEDDIRTLCEECLEYGFDGAMVQACWVPFVREQLAGSDVTVCSAVGFPMGGDRPLSKAMAIRDVVAAGAEEVDVMPNIGFVKSGRFDEVGREMELIVEASGDATCKAMLELGALTDDEAEQIADLAIDAGFDYIKNSSGWGDGGKATVERIEFLSERVDDDTRVKASGGIKSLEDATELLDAGAALLGASSGVEIVSGGVGDGEY
ncbi:deoxyribose-phosphate aldolase [Natronolimnobius baerhuensis]|uniref:Deoxyribose-phosphate aldolase n=1 Tax=Natronolimnobius baerhuensis TaxID=253108 RepID=A0A202E538_9EURY|nr:deoxyribose-phosphate aldolase [Natronolimnobius baerhuensis]OVE83010.1 deoxyribose-phosphate aldolase [Natronolimnobius baerhuensis]